MSENLCIPPEELDGFGAILRFYDPTQEEWVIVGGTKDLDFPDDEVDSLDTTSPDNATTHRTKIPARLGELGDLDVEMNFRRSQWARLVNIKKGRHTLCWQIVLMQTPEQWYYQFCGFIGKLGGTIPQGDLIMASIGITPSGAPSTGQLVS